MRSYLHTRTSSSMNTEDKTRLYERAITEHDTAVITKDMCTPMEWEQVKSIAMNGIAKRKRDEMVGYNVVRLTR